MTSPMVAEPLSYFRQFAPDRSQLIIRLEKEAAAEKIPIVGPVAAMLLYILARLHRAEVILELGTAIGYSTIFLGKACLHTNGRVISYEADTELARRARANLKQDGLEKIVEVRCEDALAALKNLEDPVDLIFMDIEKEDYLSALPACGRLLRSGGLLFADNTGFRDAEPFNQAIHSDPAWEAVNIWSFLPGHSPDHDGICLALKL